MYILIKNRAIFCQTNNHVSICISCDASDLGFIPPTLTNTTTKPNKTAYKCFSYYAFLYVKTVLKRKFSKNEP